MYQHITIDPKVHRKVNGNAGSISSGNLFQAFSSRFHSNLPSNSLVKQELCDKNCKLLGEIIKLDGIVNSLGRLSHYSNFKTSSRDV
jgi:hypothetical protein